jgi:nitronate monooxygenase
MIETPLTHHAGVSVPLICGAMYPCSNPELVAAVSHAGGLGIVQPISMTYVHGHDFRQGLRLIRSLTPNPIGMNALIEKSSRSYMKRMEGWVTVALDEGVRFFVTSLGNPAWVAKQVHAAGGVVYHDVTEARWAAKGRDAGVDGLIAVNRRAGGHPGERTVEELIEELAPFGLPVVCAGGIGDCAGFATALKLGYAGVQMGTRFIATNECRASDAYKQAIVHAREEDIVLSERITGVPVAVLNTKQVQRMGTRASSLERWMLRGRRRKHWMRTFYALHSIWKLKRASLDTSGSQEFWQAGKSVATIDSVESAGNIVRRCAESLTHT